MIYRIEYDEGWKYNFAYHRKDLLEWLKILKDEKISDIRKIYKSGAEVSVLGKYRDYVNRNAGCGEKQEKGGSRMGGGYRYAEAGRRFVLTKEGYEKTPDLIKRDRGVGKPILGFEDHVPVSWIQKGYVELENQEGIQALPGKRESAMQELLGQTARSHPREIGQSHGLDR